MSGIACSQRDAPSGNLLAVEDNGGIWSRKVSQVYGRTLLGAMVLPVDFAPRTELHGSFLSPQSSLTLNDIITAARAIAPKDNFMFIDKSGKILSCCIDPDHGVALLENLEDPEEDALAQPVLCPLATSTPPANTPAILSDHFLSSANRRPYDRDWMSNNNISEACLHGCAIRPKLDVLLRHGAIRAGDKFCVTYHHNSTPIVKFGEVLRTPNMARLDLRIALDDSYGTLRHCRGPRDILRVMDMAFQHLRRSKVPGGWRAVRVVAGDGREVGSLWTVRKAYGVFAEMMGEWGERSRRISM